MEKFPFHHESLHDFKVTAQVAWLYAKAVTLVMTHCESTNEVIRKNRRVGSSMSGVAQFLHARGDEEFIRWCDETYHAVCDFDRRLSASWQINQSIKKTSVKPSGTVSLLAGATPGCHFPIRNCYIRRVRYPRSNRDWEALAAAGYKTEPAVISYRDWETRADPVYDDRTVVVEFPVRAGGDAPPTEWEVSLARKVEVAVLLQRHWADNQVSCTASFLPEEGDQIAPLLAANDRALKGISFLPLREDMPYPQMPYESITEEQYEERVAGLKPVVWPEDEGHLEEERGCEAGLCQVELKA